MSTVGTCPVCDAPSSGYKYCLNCGHRFGAAGPRPLPPTPEYAANPAPDEEAAAPEPTRPVIARRAALAAMHSAGESAGESSEESSQDSGGDSGGGGPEDSAGHSTGTVADPGGSGLAEPTRTVARHAADETAEVPLLPLANQTEPATETAAANAGPLNAAPLNSSPADVHQLAAGPGASGSNISSPVASGAARLRAASELVKSKAIGGKSAPLVIGVLALVVVVLLIAAIGLVTMLSRGDDPTPKKSPSAQVGKAETTATCWNDKRVRRLSKCPPLTGTSAMSWVFSSLDTELCRQAATPGAIKTAWQCRMKSDSGFARVRYLEFDSAAALRDWVRAQNRGVPRSLVRSVRDDPERWVWRERKPGPDDRWTTTSSYVGDRWAVTVRSRDKAARNAAFDAIEFRPLRWLNGVPDSDRTTG